MTNVKGDARITLKDIEDGEDESEDELQPVNFGVRETPKPVSAGAHDVPQAQNGKNFLNGLKLTTAARVIERGHIFLISSVLFINFCK